MRPLFVLGLMAIAAFAAIGAASLKPDLSALPLRMPEAALIAEADSSPWRTAGLSGDEAGAFGDAMLTGPQAFTVMAGAPGQPKTLIHVTPAPQGGLLLLSDNGRWTYVANPADLRGALDALAWSGQMDL